MKQDAANSHDRRPLKVRRMFDRIARSYDLLNRLITFGRDEAWRRYVVRKASLSEDGSVLDVGTGTGRIAFALRRRSPGARVVATDFSREMLNVARENPDAERISWVRGDALSLPFPDASFDAVVSGYLVRNVQDPLAAFREQARVLKRGGRVVCLETSTREAPPFVRFYLHRVIPFVGALIAHDHAAYTYLPKSSGDFLSTEELALVMEKSGFEVVEVKKLMFGTQIVITAERSGGVTMFDRGETFSIVSLSQPSMNEY
jgi:demethylmenaquinone methyltransferase / 2-methoxy-6-polyprenyl-1,4-benzoquinol methylase